MGRRMLGRIAARRTRRTVLHIVLLIVTLLLMVRCVAVNAPAADNGNASLSLALPLQMPLATPTAAPSTPEATPTAAPPTPTPAPTFTPTPEPTATPTETPVPPTPTPAPTLVVVTARANTDVLNVRAAPGTDAAVLGQLARDAAVYVLGRNADDTWLHVCCVNVDVPGWISAALVVVTGDLAAVPVE